METGLMQTTSDVRPFYEFALKCNTKVDRKVLILEDERLIALDIKKQLEKLNFEVVACVTNAKDALKALRELEIDIALLDIHVEGYQDGISLGQQIREYFEIPFIYITAYGTDETIDRAKVTNPYGFITKPIHRTQLLSTIEIALHRKFLETQLEDKSQAEKLLIKKLAASEKLESISKLATYLAHDIDSSLFAVMENLEFVQNMNCEQNVRKHLQSAMDCCAHSSYVIKQMLVTANCDTELEILPVGEIIKDVLSTMEPVIRDGVTISINRDGSLSTIKARRSQVRQVVTNLIKNAEDAIKNEGQIKISFNNQYVENPKIYNKNAGTNFYTTIRVEDSGSGIDEENLDKIFDPLFSTKLSNNTYGLGLFTAYKIMQAHAGWIEVSSIVGEGTSFTLFFPQQNVFRLQN